MSFVGKVLIVVQVVMAVCFMAFAGAVSVTHNSWKAKAEQLEVDLAEKEKTANANKAELDTYKTEAISELGKRDQEITKLENAARIASSDLADVRDRYNKIQAEIETLRSLVASHQAESINRKKESTILRGQGADLQVEVDQLLAKLRSTEDQRFNLETDLRRVQAAHDDLLMHNGLLTSIVKKNGLPSDPLILRKMSEAPPQVQGVVVNAKEDKATGRTKFIEISIGSDDELEVGYSLAVFRTPTSAGDPSYLGMVRVISVYPDSAVCEVINPAKQGNIKVGDNVATKL